MKTPLTASREALQMRVCSYALKLLGYIFVYMYFADNLKYVLYTNTQSSLNQ